MRYLCSQCATSAKVNMISLIACGVLLILASIIFFLTDDITAAAIILCSGLLIAFVGISSLYMIKKAMKCNIEEFYDANVKVHIDDNAVFIEMDPNKRE